MAGQDSENRYQNVFSGTLSNNSGDMPGSAGDRAVFGQIAAAVSNGCLDRLLGELWSLLRNSSIPMASGRQDRLASWASFFSTRYCFLQRATGKWPALRMFVQYALECGDPAIREAAGQWLADGNADWTVLSSSAGARFTHVESSAHPYSPEHPGIPGNPGIECVLPLDPALFFRAVELDSGTALVCGLRECVFADTATGEIRTRIAPPANMIFNPLFPPAVDTASGTVELASAGCGEASDRWGLVRPVPLPPFRLLRFDFTGVLIDSRLVDSSEASESGWASGFLDAPVAQQSALRVVDFGAIAGIARSRAVGDCGCGGFKRIEAPRRDISDFLENESADETVQADPLAASVRVGDAPARTRLFVELMPSDPGASPVRVFDADSGFALAEWQLRCAPEPVHALLVQNSLVPAACYSKESWCMRYGFRSAPGRIELFDAGGCLVSAWHHLDAAGAFWSEDCIPCAVLKNTGAAWPNPEKDDSSAPWNNSKHIHCIVPLFFANRRPAASHDRGGPPGCAEPPAGPASIGGDGRLSLDDSFEDLAAGLRKKLESPETLRLNARIALFERKSGGCLRLLDKARKLDPLMLPSLYLRGLWCDEAPDEFREWCLDSGLEFRRERIEGALAALEDGTATAGSIGFLSRVPEWDPALEALPAGIGDRAELLLKALDGLNGSPADCSVREAQLIRAHVCFQAARYAEAASVFSAHFEAGELDANEALEYVRALLEAGQGDQAEKTFAIAERNFSRAEMEATPFFRAFGNPLTGGLQSGSAVCGQTQPGGAPAANKTKKNFLDEI